MIGQGQGNGHQCQAMIGQGQDWGIMPSCDWAMPSLAAPSFGPGE